MSEISLVQMLEELTGPGDNRQLYENASQTQSDHAEYCQTAGALHGAKPPNLVIASEKPEHRMVLLLKLRGMSHREIAEQTGYTLPWVSEITRQPWFRQRLTEMLDTAGEDIIENRMKMEGNNSLDTMIELRDNPQTPANVRGAMAVNILDRLMGKPTQRTETVANVFHVTAKVEDLDRQLAEVEAQERALLQRGATLTLPAPDKFNS